MYSQNKFVVQCNSSVMISCASLSPSRLAPTLAAEMSKIQFHVPSGGGGGLALLGVSPELLGNVGLDDGELLHGLEPLLGVFHLVMLLEVLNVLRVRQVLELCVLVVVLFPVVDLVLVLVVAVVAGPGAEVGQRLSGVDIVHPLLAADREVGVLVEEAQQDVEDLVFPLLLHALVRVVEEAVRAHQLGGLPPAVAVVVVEGEEGVGVPALYMMLLCRMSV